MAETLKAKTYSAMFWSMFERVGHQGIQFIISIILARLLFPEDFGLIGMLAIFMAIAQSLMDSGFGSALIQKQDADQVDKSSIFYFNILVGFFAAGLLCLAAPWIAAFYERPELTALTRFLSLNMIINSFAIVQSTLLTKQIDFKTQLKIRITAVIISGTIGVTLAFREWGVWSLAIQSVISTSMSTILLWFFSRWRPSLVLSFAALRRMFNFGSRMMFSGLLDTIFQNIYIVVIGKIFSAADLGFYTRARNSQRLTTDNLTNSVARVTFPVFSQIQDDNARIKRGLRKALTALALVNFPLMIGIIVTAKPMVSVLLTEKWLPCVFYLQLLCVVGLLYPIHAINLNLLMAKGRSDLFLRLEILKKILVVINIAITFRWGIAAMIGGQIACSVLAYYLNSYYTGKMIKYTLINQVMDMLPYGVLAGFMGVVIYSLQYLHFPNNWSLLMFQIIVGLVIYPVLCWILRLPAFVEVWQTGRSRILLFKTA